VLLKSNGRPWERSSATSNRLFLSQPTVVNTFLSRPLWVSLPVDRFLSGFPSKILYIFLVYHALETFHILSARSLRLSYKSTCAHINIKFSPYACYMSRQSYRFIHTVRGVRQCNVCVLLHDFNKLSDRLDRRCTWHLRRTGFEFSTSITISAEWQIYWCMWIERENCGVSGMSIYHNTNFSH